MRGESIQKDNVLMTEAMDYHYVAEIYRKNLNDPQNAILYYEKSIESGKKNALQYGRGTMDMGSVSDLAALKKSLGMGIDIAALRDAYFVDPLYTGKLAYTAALTEQNPPATGELEKVRTFSTEYDKALKSDVGIQCQNIDPSKVKSYADDVIYWSDLSCKSQVTAIQLKLLKSHLGSLGLVGYDNFLDSRINNEQKSAENWAKSSRDMQKAIAEDSSSDNTLGTILQGYGALKGGTTGAAIQAVGEAETGGKSVIPGYSAAQTLSDAQQAQAVPRPATTQPTFPQAAIQKNPLSAQQPNAPKFPPVVTASIDPPAKFGEPAAGCISIDNSKTHVGGISTDSTSLKNNCGYRISYRYCVDSGVFDCSGSGYGAGEIAAYGEDGISVMNANRQFEVYWAACKSPADPDGWRGPHGDFKCHLN